MYPSSYPRRGRGGYGANNRASTRSAASLPAVRFIMDGLGTKVLATVDKRSLRFVGGADALGAQPEAALPREDVVFDDFQCIASYSWTDSSLPTLLVPGMVPSFHRYH
jgi:hypothetical protein